MSHVPYKDSAVNNGQKRKMWSLKAVVSSDVTLVFICVEVIHGACAVMKLKMSIFWNVFPLFVKTSLLLTLKLSALTGEVALPD